MPHQRQIIREAVRAQLLGRTSAGARVYETRVVPLKRIDLPAISVYALEESVDPESRSTAPRELARTIQLAVEGIVEQGSNVDDAVDALALEIERAMHADPTFGDVASDSLLSSTEIDIAEQGDRPVGLLRLTYAVTYFTGAPEAADVVLDDFKTADIRHSLGGAVHPDNQAHDTLTGLEE